MPTDTLFRTLKALPPSEWTDLRTKVDAWHALGGRALARQATSHEQTGVDYVTGIIHELRRRRLISRSFQPARVISEKALTKVDSAWSQVLRQMPRKLSVVEQTALSKIAAHALARYLEKQVDRNGQPIPLGVKRMFDNADKTLEAVDHAFPGYMAAGLLSMVVRNKNGR